jgi:hypothetical protein
MEVPVGRTFRVAVHRMPAQDSSSWRLPAHHAYSRLPVLRPFVRGGRHRC